MNPSDAKRRHQPKAIRMVPTSEDSSSCEMEEQSSSSVREDGMLPGTANPEDIVGNLHRIKTLLLSYSEHLFEVQLKGKNEVQLSLFHDLVSICNPAFNLSKVDHPGFRAHLLGAVVSKIAFDRFELEMFDEAEDTCSWDASSTINIFSRKYLECAVLDFDLLMKKSSSFGKWYRRLAEKFCAVLGVKPDTPKEQFLMTKNMKDLCKEIWQLHLLSFALPGKVELIRRAPGSTHLFACHDITANETLVDEGFVAFMVLPGVRYQDIICPCEVWMGKL